MPVNGQGKKRPATKFYQEDLVQRASDSSYGVVLRCWHDGDDFPVTDADAEKPADPLMRPLKHGEVGVSFYPSNARDILPEDEFRLIDRPFQIGDVCKRHIEDMQSGVVTGVEVKFKVAHAITDKLVEGWKTLDDVKDFEDVTIGDYVTYNDWVGQVQDMFDEATVETSNGSLVRLPEISARLDVGDRGSDILPSPPAQGWGGILNFLMGEIRPSPADVVIAVKHTVYAIAWMAINQTLSSQAAAEHHRPKRFWSGADLNKLTLIRGLQDQVLRPGHKLTLKSTPTGFVTLHGRADDINGPVTVDSFVVNQTQTTVKVLWQDGTSGSYSATELVPYLSPDEYDCWPGDHVVWKTEDSKQPAVVQSVNALDRIGYITLYDGRRELVSVLELDPHGPESTVGGTQDVFGVRRGDLVFIHPPGSTNGCEKPMVPSIGEIEEWANEISYAEESGEYTGWRKELESIGQAIARSRGAENVIDGAIKIAGVGEGSVDWFGEVSNLRLDGLVEVALPDLTVIHVPLERLTRLIDGLEQLEDAWGDELSDGGSDGIYDGEGHTNEIVEIQTEDGQWQAYGEDDDDGDWVEEDDDADVQDVEMVDAFDEPTTPTGDEAAGDGTTEVPGNTVLSETATDDTQGVAMEDKASSDDEPDDEPSWSRFEILPSAPPDHMFYATPPSQPSRQFLSRLSKEYRALSTSLPESIIVRTYEDRTDLLRTLIIGPENTPYEDAPFVIDWMLDSNFPQSPPIAHFLSWTNGNGRVNPNLYEEGKVCLSILGTWAGDRSESWSAARSSILQALVSIQGLVLVKEPWYCEPAYEKWRGTDEGKVNSRLYSEKAYVLSRGFVRRALQIPLSGLEDVVNDLYYTRGKLAKVVKGAKDLIEKSKAAKEGEDDEELAVPRLTAGGVITLSRTLEKLEEIMNEHQSSSASLAEQD